METMNKLRANMTCIIEAEQRHAKLQQTATTTTTAPVPAVEDGIVNTSGEEQKKRKLVHPGGGL